MTCNVASIVLANSFFWLEYPFNELHYLLLVVDIV